MRLKRGMRVQVVAAIPLPGRPRELKATGAKVAARHIGRHGQITAQLRVRHSKRGYWLHEVRLDLDCQMCNFQTAELVETE